MHRLLSLRRDLRDGLGWIVTGEWSEPQLTVLWEAGQALERLIADLQGRPPGGWVPQYLPARFRRAGIAGRVGPLKGKSFVFPRHVVSMCEGFESSAHPHGHIFHEMGHVLDNHLGGWLPATFVGGGPADRMVRAVGGMPARAGLRFLPRRDYPWRVTPREHWPGIVCQPQRRRRLCRDLRPDPCWPRRRCRPHGWPGCGLLRALPAGSGERWRYNEARWV